MSERFTRHDVARDFTGKLTWCPKCVEHAPCRWNRLLDRAVLAERCLGEVAQHAIGLEHELRTLRAQYGNEDHVGELPRPGEYLCPRCGHVVAANHTTEGCFGRLMQQVHELREQRNALARDLDTEDADVVQRAWAALPGKVDEQRQRILALERENMELRVRLAGMGLTAQITGTALRATARPAAAGETPDGD